MTVAADMSRFLQLLSFSGWSIEQNLCLSGDEYNTPSSTDYPIGCLSSPSWLADGLVGYALLKVNREETKWMNTTAMWTSNRPVRKKKKEKTHIEIKEREWVVWFNQITNVISCAFRHRIRRSLVPVERIRWYTYAGICAHKSLGRLSFLLIR